MKSFFIVLILLFSLFADPRKTVEQSIDVLKRKELKEIDNIVENPFIVEEKQEITSNKITEKMIPEVEESQKITIQCIYNSSVLIGNQWYKVGDSVFEKQIVLIDDKGIILEQGEKKELVIFNSSNQYRDIEIGKLK